VPVDFTLREQTLQSPCRFDAYAPRYVVGLRHMALSLNKMKKSQITNLALSDGRFL